MAKLARDAVDPDLDLDLDRGRKDLVAEGETDFDVEDGRCTCKSPTSWVTPALMLFRRFNGNVKSVQGAATWRLAMTLVARTIEE